MPCGLFGKLPSKRDFVSYNMPRPFLDRWEQWLQASVAHSKLALGDSWQDIYLTAPIWRFWCGAEVFGQAVAGALMPSVDGVGRYFPLSICSCEVGADTYLVSPPDADLDTWYHASERMLLTMLEDSLPDEPGQMVAQLADAPIAVAYSSAMLEVSQGMLVSQDASIDAAFAALTALNAKLIHRRRSYWWTTGGGSHGEQLVAKDGPVDAELFNMIISGAFDRAHAQ